MTVDDAKKELEDEINFLRQCEVWEMDIVFKITNDKKHAYINVTINGETREFHPIEFCEDLFYLYSEKADNATYPNGKLNLNKQALLFVQIKGHIIQITERFKRFITPYKDCEKYDFSGVFNQISAPIENARLKLDIKLSNSQVASNKSTIITNEISRKTNTYIAIFTGVAGAYYLHEFLGFIIPNLCLYDKNTIVNTITIICVCVFAYHMLSEKEERKQQPPKQDP